MGWAFTTANVLRPSMKVPTRRWGNHVSSATPTAGKDALNESPHPKVGKCYGIFTSQFIVYPLNESPHPKVGKSHA